MDNSIEDGFNLAKVEVPQRIQKRTKTKSFFRHKVAYFYNTSYHFYS